MTRANRRDLVFVTAHLPLDNGPDVASERRAHCAGRILAWCDAIPEGEPLVVAGDLNSAPGTGAVEAFLERGFCDAGTVSAGRPIPTMPSHDPVVPLDYVLVRGAKLLSGRAVGNVADAEGYYPSDHLGLLAELVVGRAAKRHRETGRDGREGSVGKRADLTAARPLRSGQALSHRESEQGDRLARDSRSPFPSGKRARGLGSCASS